MIFQEPYVPERMTSGPEKVFAGATAGRMLCKRAWNVNLTWQEAVGTVETDFKYYLDMLHWLCGGQFGLPAFGSR